MEQKEKYGEKKQERSSYNSVGDLEKFLREGDRIGAECNGKDLIIEGNNGNSKVYEIQIGSNGFYLRELYKQSNISARYFVDEKEFLENIGNKRKNVIKNTLEDALKNPNTTGMKIPIKIFEKYPDTVGKYLRVMIEKGSEKDFSPNYKGISIENGEYRFFSSKGNIEDDEIIFKRARKDDKIFEKVLFEGMENPNEIWGYTQIAMGLETENQIIQDEVIPVQPEKNYAAKGKGFEDKIKELKESGMNKENIARQVINLSGKYKQDPVKIAREILGHEYEKVVQRVLFG